MFKAILTGLLLLLGYIVFNLTIGVELLKPQVSNTNKIVEPIKQFIPTITPKITLQSPPSSKILANTYHIFQSYNNCRPAALSMALSYYGIIETQQKLGQDLRPYQPSSGDNDDKSVTLEELAEKSLEYNLVPFHRPNGNLELIKLFISYEIPVITRTWLKPNDDIGHYRIIKGYDGNIIIQDDSLQGKNLTMNI